MTDSTYGCGHACCDERTDPLHDHFLGPSDCPICAAKAKKTRKSSLTTLDWYALNRACEPVWDAFGHTYLVGTAATGGDYRDVDVRTILLDEDFDRLCADRQVWTLLCTSIGTLLRQATGMPIDYQIQRMTEANERFPGGNRHPVGMVVEFAGGGDATAFGHSPTPDANDDSGTSGEVGR